MTSVPCTNLLISYFRFLSSSVTNFSLIIPGLFLKFSSGFQKHPRASVHFCISYLIYFELENNKLLTQNQIGVLYMVGSVICFSIMDICVKWLDYYPIGQVLFLRFFIGFIPIFFIIPKDKLLSFYKTSRPGLHAFRAITGALAIIALFFGLRELPLVDVVFNFWRTNIRYNSIYYFFV